MTEAPRENTELRTELLKFGIEDMLGIEVAPGSEAVKDPAPARAPPNPRPRPPGTGIRVVGMTGKDNGRPEGMLIGRLGIPGFEGGRLRGKSVPIGSPEGMVGNPEGMARDRTAILGKLGITPIVGNEGGEGRPTDGNEGGEGRPTDGTEGLGKLIDKLGKPIDGMPSDGTAILGKFGTAIDGTATGTEGSTRVGIGKPGNGKPGGVGRVGGLIMAGADNPGKEEMIGTAMPPMSQVASEGLRSDREKYIELTCSRNSDSGVEITSACNDRVKRQHRSQGTMGVQRREDENGSSSIHHGRGKS